MLFDLENIMRLPFVTTLLIATAIFSGSLAAQQRRSTVTPKPKGGVVKSGEVGQTAFVIDETLSVLRSKPSLFSDSIQRMRRGRKVQILAVTEADGVKFYRVTAPPANYGWVQADAVFGKFRGGDEERLARLVQASDGFEQLEIAGEFFNIYPESSFRPSILLLYGDLLEEVAAKLSKDAASRLSRKEMAAGGAPLHSYFLNFNMLDRYRKLDIIFQFNPATRQFHYDGASWRQVVAKSPTSPETIEAQKRLDSLKVKMERVSVK
jgi:hypothetical protein